MKWDNLCNHEFKNNQDADSSRIEEIAAIQKLPFKSCNEQRLTRLCLSWKEVKLTDCKKRLLELNLLTIYNHIQEVRDHFLGETQRRHASKGFHQGVAMEKAGNFMTADDVTKTVCLEVADFAEKMNPTAFFIVLCLWKIILISTLCPTKKVRFGQAKLKGPAHLWQHSIEDQLYRTNQPPTMGGNELQDKTTVLPTDYEHTLYTKMLYLKQGDRTGEEYMEDFHELTIWNLSVRK